MALSVTKKDFFKRTNTHTASAIAGGSHTNAVGIAAPDAPSLAPVPREVPRDAYAAASFISEGEAASAAHASTAAEQTRPPTS